MIILKLNNNNIIIINIDFGNADIIEDIVLYPTPIIPYHLQKETYFALYSSMVPGTWNQQKTNTAIFESFQPHL